MKKSPLNNSNKKIYAHKKWSDVELKYLKCFHF